MGFIGEDLLEGISKAAPFVFNGERIGVPFNLQQLVDAYGKEIIPDQLGIYHLFFEDQLVYIGMSKSIRGRLRMHLKDKDMPFNNVLWFCSKNYPGGLTIKQTLTIEYNMIKKFKPVLNSMHCNCR